MIISARNKTQRFFAPFGPGFSRLQSLKGNSFAAVLPLFSLTPSSTDHDGSFALINSNTYLLFGAHSVFDKSLASHRWSTERSHQ